MPLDDSIPTPAFIIDGAILERNCATMRAKALRSGVAFRPHVKTHKTVEIAMLQHGGARGPITVSTLAEAEFFAGAGFTDITYAVPIAPSKLERAARLAQRIERLNILIDGPETLHAVEKVAAERNRRFDAFLKIDCGYHRAGVDPDHPDSIRLAIAMAESPGIHFQGVLTHAGHSYNAHDTAEIVRIAGEETSALTRFREALAPNNLGHVTRSIGSTPTASVVETFVDCDEVRPGNYVFYDAFQATIGSCDLSDCAVSVLTTVVSLHPERGALLVDAGALALSKDRGPDHLDPQFGYGVVCDERMTPLPLKVTSISQEHGKIEGDIGALHSIVGARLRIVPNHSCLTAALYDRYHVVDGESIEVWRPVRGW
jgi:D-serine deaminase-like pyridoxal phosphate-dependent protein